MANGNRDRKTEVSEVENFSLSCWGQKACLPLGYQDRGLTLEGEEGGGTVEEREDPVR